MLLSTPSWVSLGDDRICAANIFVIAVMIHNTNFYMAHRIYCPLYILGTILDEIDSEFHAHVPGLVSECEGVTDFY